MEFRQMKAMLCLALAILSLFVFSPLAGAEDLYDSVIRIHVLANSDDPQDQANKLLVRDRLLEYSKAHFGDFAKKDEAAAELTRHLKKMEEEARRVLEEEGYSDPVSIRLEEEYYPTRHYEDLSLPAGTYLSLRVMIGKAEGQNWWCVFFPPVCLNSAKKTDETLLSAGMEEEAVKTVTVKEGEYEFRFKILELFYETKEKIRRFFS